jgi:hypothetical protein
VKLTPLEMVGRQMSLQMVCSTCSTVRGPHSRVSHCVPKSHMKMGAPVAGSCATGTELGPPSEQKLCANVASWRLALKSWCLSLHEYWQPLTGGGGEGGGCGSGGGGRGSGGIGASVKDAAVMEPMRPSPQSVLCVRDT